jgi:hypothetical protein
MADVDLVHWAANLQVVDVHKVGNPTGWVTDRRLYDPRIPGNHAPTYTRPGWWMDHGTVGSNTLRYWGTGGSIRAGAWSLATYLIPHNETVYADNKARDTTFTVFKMIPDGYACNHAGDCITPIHNGNSIGCEYESMQNGTYDIEQAQYVKGALMYCYDSALYGIPDHARVSHGLVAEPHGRRRDPFAGPYDYDYSWHLVREVRRTKVIWQMWGLPQPVGDF